MGSAFIQSINQRSVGYSSRPGQERYKPQSCSRFAGRRGIQLPRNPARWDWRAGPRGALGTATSTGPAPPGSHLHFFPGLQSQPTILCPPGAPGGLKTTKPENENPTLVRILAWSSDGVGVREDLTSISSSVASCLCNLVMISSPARLRHFLGSRELCFSIRGLMWLSTTPLCAHPQSRMVTS